jgi:hypothetical protein
MQYFTFLKAGIAYEIIEKLKKQKEDDLLKLLATAVTETERKKGQLQESV